MLNLGLIQRETGERASKLLKVEDELLALDFDAAVAYRMQCYDNERETDKFRALGILLCGSGDGDGGDGGGGAAAAPEIEGGAEIW